MIAAALLALILLMTLAIPIAASLGVLGEFMAAGQARSEFLAATAMSN